MTGQQAIQLLQVQPFIYVLFSENGRVPYVRCDSETMIDYAEIYFDGEKAVAAAKAIAEENPKIKTIAMKIKNDDIPKILVDLVHYGVDEVKFYIAEENVTAELSSMIKLDKEKKDPSGNDFLYNQAAQISMIYLSQQLMQWKSPAEIDRNVLIPLEEEALRNILRSKYYVVFSEVKDDVQTTDGSKLPEGKKFVPLVLKNKAGNLMLPIFTDMNELRKASKGKEGVPYKIMAYTEIVDKFMLDSIEIQGIIVNPAGVALPLDKASAKKLPNDPRFKEA